MLQPDPPAHRLWEAEGNGPVGSLLEQVSPDTIAQYHAILHMTIDDMDRVLAEVPRQMSMKRKRSAISRALVTLSTTPVDLYTMSDSEYDD